MNGAIYPSGRDGEPPVRPARRWAECVPRRGRSARRRGCRRGPRIGLRRWAARASRVPHDHGTRVGELLPDDPARERGRGRRRAAGGRGRAVGSGTRGSTCACAIPHRYWIDLRLHRAPEPLLEMRIALTNDEWSIRVPLEDALTALPAGRGAEPAARRGRRRARRARRATAGRGASRRTSAAAGRSSSSASATSTRRSPPTTSTCTSTRRACEPRRRRRARMAPRARDQQDRADVGRRAGAAGPPPRQPPDRGTEPQGPRCYSPSLRSGVRSSGSSSSISFVKIRSVRL